MLVTSQVQKEFLERHGLMAVAVIAQEEGPEAGIQLAYYKAVNDILAHLAGKHIPETIQINYCFSQDAEQVTPSEGRNFDAQMTRLDLANLQAVGAIFGITVRNPEDLEETRRENRQLLQDI